MTLNKTVFFEDLLYLTQDHKTILCSMDWNSDLCGCSLHALSVKPVCDLEGQGVETRIRGPWAKSLASLSPMFFICKTQRLNLMISRTLSNLAFLSETVLESNLEKTAPGPLLLSQPETSNTKLQRG